MSIRYKLLEKVADVTGYGLIAKAPLANLPHDFTEEDRSVLREVYPYTMTSPERVVCLRRAVEYVVRNRLAGAIVECGVWRGGSMMAVARTLLELGDPGRDLYLFDTFSGMPAPTGRDRDFRGESASRLLASEPVATSHIWAFAPQDEVRSNLMKTGYPPDRFRFVEGRVEETIPASAPESVALLRLDTDWYESTYHELVHLYDRIVPCGILIVDDYGHWQGSREATDRFFDERGELPYLHRIDATARLVVKRG